MIIKELVEALKLRSYQTTACADSNTARQRPAKTCVLYFVIERKGNSTTTAGEAAVL